MATAVPPLFLDNTMNEKVRPSFHEMWALFHPFADEGFVERVRQGVVGLCTHRAPSRARTDAWFILHRCFWEMYAGCALLMQDVQLVPRADWDRSWRGAGPDLLATIDGVRVWIECIAPGPGTGEDAVPELDTDTGEAQSVPTEAINLRYLSAISGKREKFATYTKEGIVRPGDGIVIAINGRGVPMACMTDNPPWIVRILYGAGPLAVNVDRETREMSGPFLTPKHALSKRNKEPIRTTLFASGQATELSGVLFSMVDTHNHSSTPARDLIYVPNMTAAVSLPEKWLPHTVQYRVTRQGSMGTVARIDPFEGT